MKDKIIGIGKLARQKGMKATDNLEKEEDLRWNQIPDAQDKFRLAHNKWRILLGQLQQSVRDRNEAEIDLKLLQEEHYKMVCLIKGRRMVELDKDGK